MCDLFFYELGELAVVAVAPVAANAILYSSIFFLVRNLALYFKFRGLVLNLYPQHGHHNPSHFKKISHT